MKYDSLTSPTVQSCNQAASSIEPKRTGQFEQQSVVMRDAITELETAVSRLEKDLEPVLRKQETCSKEGATPEEMLVPAADVMRAFCRRVQRVTVRISEIRTCLEI